MADLTGKDVYLRVTNNSNGSSSVRHHRAWDVDRFIESQRAQYRAEGERDNNDPLLYQVSLSNAAEYRASLRSR